MLRITCAAALLLRGACFCLFCALLSPLQCKRIAFPLFSHCLSTVLILPLRRFRIAFTVYTECFSLLFPYVSLLFPLLDCVHSYASFSLVIHSFTMLYAKIRSLSFPFLSSSPYTPLILRLFLRPFWPHFPVSVHFYLYMYIKVYMLECIYNTIYKHLIAILYLYPLLFLHLWPLYLFQ